MFVLFFRETSRLLRDLTCSLRISSGVYTASPIRCHPPSPGKKLADGAHGVRKIIEFQRQRGRGHATVEARCETVAAPPRGPELRKIMEATAEADWPQDVRVALGEKGAEIRRLGEAQGDRGLLQARGAAYTLLGEPPPSGSPTKRCATGRRRTPCGRRPAWPSSS